MRADSLTRRHLMSNPLSLGLARTLVFSLTLGASHAAIQGPAHPAWDQGFEAPETLAVLPHRERADVVNRHLRARLDALLPRLMRDAGIDLWIVGASNA